MHETVSSGARNTSSTMIEALRLHELEGRSYSQVAKVMGITKWQARRLCDAGARYLRGVSDGFRLGRSAHGN